MLEIENLNLKYGQSQILHEVTLNAPVGQVTCVTGTNGVGKTSLLKAIAGRHPFSGGRISLDGEELQPGRAALSAKAGVGYVPQGREIFPRLTVRENLEIGQQASENGGEIGEEVFDLFPVLAEMQDRMGGNLSGGQQQQLAIARALVGGPKVLMLDEPTEGIQPSIILEIEKVLLQLKDRGAFTIVLVEQYFDFARQIADHFFLMDRGSILLQGAADELSDESIKSHLTF